MQCEMQTKRLWNMRLTVISYNRCTWNGPQMLGKGTGRIGNRRTNRDRPNNSIIEIGQNTERSPVENCCHSDFSVRS